MLTGRRLAEPERRVAFVSLLLAVGMAAASFGCGSEGSPLTGGGDNGEVTWNQDIAPIVTAKCVGCHQAGGIGPMTLADYASAARYSGQMLEQVQSGTMPPWGARTTDECSPPHAFKEDPRLTPAELEKLETWVEQGSPEGPPSSKVLPKPTETALKNPDLRLTIPSSVEITGTNDRFVCFTLDPGNATDRYISAVQVNPGNPTIVHHVLVFADPSGESATLAGDDGAYDCFGGPGLTGDTQLLGAWAPGSVPGVMPPDVALQLTGKSRIVLQVHYHPTRVSAEVDGTTSVDFRFAPQAPKYPGVLALIGNFGAANLMQAGGQGYGLLPGPDDPASGPAFVIPPNVTAHTESQRFLIPKQAGVTSYRLWGVGTHMHYVGHDMKIDIQRSTGETECLLQTPEWDFSWQRLYYYDAPLADVPTVRAGDVIRMRCTYDNSMQNPFVRTALGQQGIDVPIDVRLGENTLDEMCLGVFGIALQ